MVDVLIKNAFVVDGSGRPGFRADVAVKGDTITGVGDLRHLGAKRTIDAEGLVLSPGFIDAHAHSDFAIIHNPPSQSQVAQGVTTEVSCNCGKSPFPVLPNPLPLKTSRTPSGPPPRITGRAPLTTSSCSRRRASASTPSRSWATTRCAPRCSAWTTAPAPTTSCAR